MFDCPKCGKNGFYVNSKGVTWLCCDECKVRWSGYGNMFDAESEYRDAVDDPENRARLTEYRNLDSSGFIVPRECNCEIKTLCFLCGERMETRVFWTLVYSDVPRLSYEERLHNDCDVCDRCASATPDELRKRIEEHADTYCETCGCERRRELRQIAGRSIQPFSYVQELEALNHGLYADDATAIGLSEKLKAGGEIDPAEYAPLMQAYNEYLADVLAEKIVF